MRDHESTVCLSNPGIVVVILFGINKARNIKTKESFFCFIVVSIIYFFVFQMCEVHVTFEDVLLGEPLSVQVNCSESSRLFPYYLRQQLHALKRVPPFKQSISKVSDGAYSLKIRDRPAKNLIPYTIHGHFLDEYDIFIDKNDTVMDVKFLLAPLVNHGNKAEDIQLVCVFVFVCLYVCVCCV